MPPLKSYANFPLSLSNPTLIIILLISLVIYYVGIPLTSATNFKCYSIVRYSYIILFYGHNPYYFLISSGFYSKSKLFTNIYPSLAYSNPVSKFIVVVLPAPLWPNKQKT